MFYKTTHIFIEPEVQNLKRIFSETPHECFKSKQSMDHSLCTMTGKKDVGFIDFKKTVGQ